MSWMKSFMKNNFGKKLFFLAFNLQLVMQWVQRILFRLNIENSHKYSKTEEVERTVGTLANK